MAFDDDPELRAGVLALFGAVWRRLPGAIELAQSFGANWFEVSTPFVARERDRVVAHAGVIEMPLRLEGDDVVVGGVHAVCVHPDARGRGHARRVLEQALAHVDAHYETSILWSEKRELYARFGFRAEPERVTLIDAPNVAQSKPARRLNLELASDRALIQRLLAERTPVSDRLATREPGWHFWIDLALWPEAREMLWYLAQPEALLVFAEGASGPELYDVVARALPSLETIVAALPIGKRRLHVHLSADRLARATGTRENPHEDVLMVRGRWPIAGEGLALSPLCRC